MNHLLPARARAGALALAAALLLASCSTGDGAGDGSGQPEPAASPPSSSTAEASEDAAATTASPDSAGGPTEGPYLPVPSGVRLTPPGTLLAVGKPATVAFRPVQQAKQRVAALRLRVNRLRRTTFARSFEGWKLDAGIRRSRPYFVSVTVRNVGRAALGGIPVPLFLLDDQNNLLRASTFAGDFKPCPSKPLPAGFVRGERTSVCLTYLVPKGRTPAGITFRPNRNFEAITWTGDVEQPGDSQGSGNGDRSGRGNGNGRGNEDGRGSGGGQGNGSGQGDGGGQDDQQQNRG